METKMNEPTKALLDLKREIHDKATYPHGRDTYAFINLKTFDAILQMHINKYAEEDNK
jgi:hypothetical protein